MNVYGVAAGRPRRLGGWRRTELVAPPRESSPYRGPSEAGVEEDLIPEARDQGDIGQCVGECVAEVMEGCEYRALSLIQLKAARANGSRRLFSPRFAYYVGRKLEGTSPTDDAGMQVATGFRVLDLYGIPPREAWDDDQPFSREPTREAYSEAYNYKALLHLPLPNLATMKRCIDDGFSFAFGMDVSKQLMSREAEISGLVPFVDSAADFNGAGHAMTAWRRSDTIRIGSDVGGFLVLNHWSRAWGLNGRAWISYKYFLSGHATDAHSARRITLVDERQLL